MADVTTDQKAGDPGQAGVPTTALAGFGIRLAAYLIDALVVGVPVMLLTVLGLWVVDSTSISGVLIFLLLEILASLASLAYLTVMEGGPTGQTLGKRAMGISVVDARTRRSIGYGRALGRSLGRIASGSVLGLGYLWILWDPERQAWHDKFANSHVVAGRPAEDGESTEGSQGSLRVFGAGLERGILVRAGVIAALVVFTVVVLPNLVGSDWITTLTSVAEYSVVSLGLGILYGRVGMISLGQTSLLIVGVWTGTRLSYGTNLPFPLLLLASGAVACVIGVLIGLPALRLSGLYLALITLMMAGAVIVTLLAINFPNGGHGFTGRTTLIDLSGLQPVRRPSMAVGDTAYYRYVIVVCALMFVLALLHVATKPGRAWASIRESEPAALAAGVNITLYKMWAFALASFMAGVAGCLLAAQVGQPTAQSFQTQDSLTLLATTLIGGIYSLWGAVVSGVFNQLVPFVFQAQWGINPNFLLIIFGAGLIQVLLTAPGGLAQQFPRDMANLARLVVRGVRKLGARGQST